MNFVNHWNCEAGLAVAAPVLSVGVSRSTFYQWRTRCGKVNELHSWIPRDHRVTPEQRQAVNQHHAACPMEGYRQLTRMMMDDVVAVSPSTVRPLLREETKLRRPPVASTRSANEGVVSLPIAWPLIMRNPRHGAHAAAHAEIQRLLDLCSAYHHVAEMSHTCSPTLHRKATQRWNAATLFARLV